MSKPIGRPRTINVGACTYGDCPRPAHCKTLCTLHYTRLRRHGDASIRLGGPPTVQAAFQRYMPGDPPPPGVVWLWTGDVNPGNGYGRFRAENRRWPAHRASYTLFKGPIPPGAIIRHTNDIPLDVNPHHLIIGSNRDNIQDMLDRNRQPVGEGKTLAKLTDKQVLFIRDQHAYGATIASLARHHRVGETTIRNVVHRRTWKHI